MCSTNELLMQHKENNQKKLLVLGASEIQQPIIIRAKELGYYTIVADYDPCAVSFKYADKKLIISTIDNASLYKVAIENGIDGVLTTSDYPVRSVAYICDKMGLSGPTIDAAHLCTDKYLLRQHLAKNQFLVPQFKIIKSKDMLYEIDYFPCVIKPVDSSGSRGVQKVNNLKELIEAYDHSLKYSISANVIVEEFIDGDEFSIETLTQNGNTAIISITGKTVKGDKGIFFVEDRHVIPAFITNEKVLAISDIVIKVINSLNLGNSPTHTELKTSSKGIFIIEIGARLGGDYITSDLVPLATGVDMLANAINIALNNKINTSGNIKKYSGIQFITTENYERTVDFLKIENPFVVKQSIHPFKEVPLTSSFDRLGYFIVQTDTREQLNQTLNCIK
jgi:biotin carboxylase